MYIIIFIFIVFYAPLFMFLIYIIIYANHFSFTMHILLYTFTCHPGTLYSSLTTILSRTGDNE